MRERKSRSLYVEAPSCSALTPSVAMDTIATAPAVRSHFIMTPLDAGCPSRSTSPCYSIFLTDTIAARFTRFRVNRLWTFAAAGRRLAPDRGWRARVDHWQERI